MALKTLAAVAPNVIYGAGVQPEQTYLFNALSVTTPTVADQIVTPTFDLNMIAPHSNRIVIAKYSASANADVVEIQGSNDGTTWYDIPQYNSNAVCNVATAAANVSIAGLPNLRYIRGSVTLATGVPATLALALAFMRF